MTSASTFAPQPVDASGERLDRTFEFERRFAIGRICHAPCVLHACEPQPRLLHLDLFVEVGRRQ